MIALAIVGALLVAALGGVAAAAAERTLRLWGRQARWAWLAALAASLALPVAGALLARRPAAPAAEAVVPGLRVLPAIVVRAEAASGTLLSGARALVATLARHDRELALGWAALTLLALVRLARGARALRRARRAWTAARVDATPVLVARDAGPLVVGVARPEVVLPEWALALEPPARAMILRHELEHARSRDPALLTVAALAAALVPWNPAVWWQLRRLRLAVELDCDARVLRAHPDVTRYGLLLLDVARRVAPAGPALVAALVEPTTDLERRIAIMRTKPSRHRVLLSAALSLVGATAAAGAVAACRVSEAAPTATAAVGKSLRATDTVTVARVDRVVTTAADSTPPAVQQVRGPQVRVQPTASTASRPDAPAPATGGERPYFEFRITRQAMPAPGNPGPLYPQSLREAKVEGEVVAQIVVDTSGRMMPGSFKVIRTTDTLFTQAVRSVLDDMRFLPAEVDGRKVRQLLELPFAFQLTK